MLISLNRHLYVMPANKLDHARYFSIIDLPTRKLVVVVSIVKTDSLRRTHQTLQSSILFTSFPTVLKVQGINFK